MQQRFLAPVLLVITALLWSLGGVLIKSIDWPPMAIAAGRSIAAIPVLLVWARGQRFTFSPPQIGGAIAYAATVALFVFATRMKIGRASCRERVEVAVGGVGLERKRGECI